MESDLEVLSRNINLLSINDDIIITNAKINNFVAEFTNIVSNEEDLRKVLQYLNVQSLQNFKYAQNFALFITSKQMRTFTIGKLNIRSAMMNVLEHNFNDADDLKQKDICYFYNSITLLGEYYNRARLNIDDTPYQVLGQGILDLLINELHRNQNEFEANTKDHVFDVKFAKLILNQITLNGLLMRAQLKNEIGTFLNAIRNCLIKVSNLSETVKAFLMITLDLYQSNFKNLGHELETLYSKYLIEYDDDTVANEMIATPSNETVPSQKCATLNEITEILNKKY